MCGGGGSSSPPSQTVTQTTAIPDWQQGMVQANENIAQSLASQPYPNYQGQLIQGFSPMQTQGMQMTGQASTAQQPYLDAATGMVNNAANSFQPALNTAQNMTAAGANIAGAGTGYENAGAGYTAQAAGNQWNPQTAQQYMSPYAMQALAPQIQQLQQQIGQNANAINGRATQAGAYGDAQYGNEQALNNFYGNLSMNDLVAGGMNQAYNTGLGQFNTANQNLLQAGGQMGNIGGQMSNIGGQIGSLGGQMGNLANLGQQLQLNPAGAMSSLGGQAQSQGLTGANAMFNAGTQQQQLGQQQLTEAYQNFMNQVNWPYQQLNARIAATANSPYQVPTANLAPNSATAQNLGAFASLAGGVGSLLGGGSSGNLNGSPSVAGSDIRLKKNIRKLGTTKKLKLPLYEFDYIWAKSTDPKNIGVMAQDMIDIIPEAVIAAANGYLAVDYGMVA